MKNINLVNPRGVHIVRRVQLLAQADNFLCRNPGQQQPQPMVQVPGPTQDNFLNAVLAEELIVRVINPGNRLRLQGAVKHLVQNENDLLSGRVLGQKFKDCGHSGGILALGNVGNQLDAPHHLKALPGGQNPGALQAPAQPGGWHPHIPEQGDDGSQIIGVVQGPGDHGIGMRSLRIPEGHAVARSVNFRHQVVPPGGM